MESLIRYAEQKIPEPDQSWYLRLLAEIEKNKPDRTKSILQVAAENLHKIRQSLSELKQRTLSKPFLDISEEIRFFKFTKPVFHSLLIEWSGIFDLELRCPLGGQRAEEKYLRKQLRNLRNFFKEHTEFFSYYRSLSSHEDNMFFIRLDSGSNDLQNLELDHRYTTAKDRIMARIFGYERLQHYIERSIRQMKMKSEKKDGLAAESVLQWTASKAGMVELIYALHSGGVCNNGKADIKTLANQFEQFFHVELTNFYHVFNEIRLRKKSRTQLLDTLKENVIRKMDEMDVKD